MKIAFMSDAAFPWHMGGLEVVELAEASELAKRHEVHFFSMKWQGMREEFVKDRIHYHTSIPITRDTFYRHGRRSVRVAIMYMFSTFRIFNYRFDAIEVNMFPFIHLPIVKLFCKLTGCKMLLDVVEVWSKQYWTEYLGGIVGRLGYWYTSYFCMSSDAYIVNSTITESKLRDLGIGPHRIFRFAPVLDDRLIGKVRGEKLKKEQRIFFWGRLIKEKRLDKWLGIFNQVNKRLPKTKGLIGGGGPDKENIVQLVRDMDLQKAVSIKPYIDGDANLFREFARIIDIASHVREGGHERAHPAMPGARRACGAA